MNILCTYYNKTYKVNYGKAAYFIRLGLVRIKLTNTEGGNDPGDNEKKNDLAPFHVTE